MVKLLVIATRFSQMTYEVSFFLLDLALAFSAIPFLFISVCVYINMLPSTFKLF